MHSSRVPRNTSSRAGQRFAEALKLVNLGGILYEPEGLFLADEKGIKTIEEHIPSGDPVGAEEGIALLSKASWIYLLHVH